MNHELKHKKAIKNKITSNLNSPQDVYDLFSLLNYPDEFLFDISAKRRKEDFDFKEDDFTRVNEIYSVMGFKDDYTNKRKNLPVFLLEVTTLTPSFIRSVTKKIDSQYSYFLLIFSVDYSNIIFVLPKKEKIETGKHKLKITKLVIDKDELVNKKEHYTVVETLYRISYKGQTNWRDVLIEWRKAFDVERVTKVFFEDYKSNFFKLRNTFREQDFSKKDSHEFTLKLLNRIMFIYFISKKNWLKYPKFIDWFWTKYKKQGNYGNDEFYDIWLKQVFFKAFNNRSDEIENLPEEVNKVLADVPFLNGGLFKKVNLDEKNFEISDAMIKGLFRFFEKYNFTIKEDMPLESEVAVDPQMLGYVYESLANVAEEIYDKNDLGIFYTPRIEVDFMCRNSIVHYLMNNLQEIDKEQLYHFVFDAPDVSKDTIEYFSKNNLWRYLENSFDNISVVDPACGSGAFLVGMLNVLTQLMKIVYSHRDIKLTDFKIKSRIIARSLYGVDVMPWALEAAELRLWLQLIIETKLDKHELTDHALLPNLDMNLRKGDSLIQGIADMDIHIRDLTIPKSVEHKINELKNEKVAYVNNEPTAKYQDKSQIFNEENIIIQAIVINHLTKLEKYKKQYDVQQTNLIEEIKEEHKGEIKLEKIEKEIEKFNKIYNSLTNTESKPFIWDIDFIEIFANKNGFDIVIGNPPYVRQEKISPPNRTKSEVSSQDRTEYKDKLIESVKKQFPVIDKIGKRSDYYIYFYFHGLNLLNDKGTFCFITSNSWLDVGYGKSLQEFLCKYVPIYGIYDSPKRSFKHADINTVITLFGSPYNHAKKLHAVEDEYPALNDIAKFIMFKKPFGQVLSAKNLIQIDKIQIKTKGEKSITELVDNVRKTNDYRVFPIKQEDLLEDGWEYPDDYEGKRFKAGKYKGNKWGGKFLRAPDIFYTILEKGKDKFTELKNVIKVKAGIITGNNKKFYKKREKGFDKKRYSLVFKSPREVNKVWLTKKDAKSIIKITKIPFEIRKAKFLWVDLRGDKHICHYNSESLPFEHNFYGLNPKNEDKVITYCSLLNSTLSWFFIETLGRRGLGGGAIRLVRLDIDRFPVFQINDEKIEKSLKKVFQKLARRPIKPIFEECGIDRNKPIREQEPNPLPDRAELDNIIFGELGLSAEERKEVYWAVCELVKQRLDKAKSLKK